VELMEMERLAQKDWGMPFLANFTWELIRNGMPFMAILGVLS